MRALGLLLQSTVALGLMSAVAFADPVQPGATAAAAPTEDPNEIICKNAPPPTGSRLGGGRECHTRYEWDQRTKAAQQNMFEQQQRGLAGTPGGPGG
jgi:hypothetical protein